MSDEPIRSAKRQFAATILGLEILVIFFAGLTATSLKVAGPAQVWLVVAVLIALAVVAMRTLKTELGYGIGSAVQGAVMLSGFFLPVMWFLGAVFVGLWVMALILGTRIDRERLEYAAQ